MAGSGGMIHCFFFCRTSESSGSKASIPNVLIVINIERILTKQDSLASPRSQFSNESGFVKFSLVYRTIRTILGGPVLGDYGNPVSSSQYHVPFLKVVSLVCCWMNGTRFSAWNPVEISNRV